MAQRKSNEPSGKPKSPSASLYPEILLCFRLATEWGCDSPTPGHGAVAPHLQTGLVGKGREGGQEGAPWKLQPPSQPLSQQPTSSTNSKTCTPKDLCCKSMQILSISPVGWNHAHESGTVGTATAQPAWAGWRRPAVTGGTSLKPSAVSKKKYILGNTMVTNLHQIWNCMGKRSSLTLFNYLTFQILGGGFPLDYFKQDISLLFLKPSHSITEWDWISAREFCFFRIQQLTPNEWEKEKPVLWKKDKEKSNLIRNPMPRPLNSKAIACVEFP